MPYAYDPSSGRIIWQDPVPNDFTGPTSPVRAGQQSGGIGQWIASLFGQGEGTQATQADEPFPDTGEPYGPPYVPAPQGGGAPSIYEQGWAARMGRDVAQTDLARRRAEQIGQPQQGAREIAPGLIGVPQGMNIYRQGPPTFVPSPAAAAGDPGGMYATVPGGLRQVLNTEEEQKARFVEAQIANYMDQIRARNQPRPQRAERIFAPGTGESNAARAAHDTASAAYMDAKTKGYPEELASEIAQRAAAAELSRAHAANLAAQPGFEQQRIENQATQFGQTYGLNREIGLGNLGVAQGQLALAGRTQEGNLGLGYAQLGSQRDIANRQLTQSGEIAAGQQQLSREQGQAQIEQQARALAQQGRLADADRLLRSEEARGYVNGLPTLARELGIGHLSNESASIYGFGPDSRPTLAAQEAVGQVGGAPTLARGGLMGYLDGQETLAGRQQRAAEEGAAFQRLSTPTAYGALAGLAQRGLVPRSALTTGNISGIGGMATPARDVNTFGGGMRDYRMGGGAGVETPTFIGGREDTAVGEKSPPLQFSLQSLRGLNPRETQTLGGYTGAMGRDFSDIQSQAQQEMADLGEGAQRRQRVRLGGY